MMRFCHLTLLLSLTTAAIQANAADVPYLRCFALASQQHRVPMETLIGIARVESSFKADARSAANAHGIMQIRWPLTARHLGIRRVAELYNPCVNINAGAAYFSELLNRYKGDETLALAAYNYGPSRISTASDVPANVMRYVSRVRSAKPEEKAPISKRSSKKGSKNDRKHGNISLVELNRFKTRSRASQYASAITRVIPTLKVTLSNTHSDVRVLLDPTSMSYSDRVRLAMLTGHSIEKVNPS